MTHLAPGDDFKTFLGIDPTAGGGQGILARRAFLERGLRPQEERIDLELRAIFSNLFNHNRRSDPYLVVGDTPDGGGLGGLSDSHFTGQAHANSSPTMEFGLRLRFQSPNEKLDQA